MNALQKAIESEIQKIIGFPKVVTKLIEDEISALGITLTDDQLSQIESDLSSLGDNIYSFTIDDKLLENAGLNTEDFGDDFQIEIGKSDEDIERVVNQMMENVQESMPEIVDQLSESLFNKLHDDISLIVANSEQTLGRIEEVIKRRWKKPLDLLEMFISLALEAGSEFNKEFREKASLEQNFVFDALTRLHARACSVAYEILTLLKSGYADGAHARWRTLHEISVVGVFIQSFGNDVAERYLLHDSIESYKAAKQYQKHYTALGYDAIPQDEIKELEKTYNTLINRFGSNYKSSYGWAASKLGKRNPTFSDIEENVNLDHLRPFYKLASHNVHANPKGILFKLGSSLGQDLLLAGPSIYGLADPGHGTAIALNQITSILLTTEPNVDRLVACNMLMKLSNEVGNEFLKVHEEVEEAKAASLQEK